MKAKKKVTKKIEVFELSEKLPRETKISGTQKECDETIAKLRAIYKVSIEGLYNNSINDVRYTLKLSKK